MCDGNLAMANALEYDVDYNETLISKYENVKRQQKEIPLSEAILIIENLIAYGKIHTVKGVRYIEGSHEEIIDKAEKWLNKVK